MLRFLATLAVSLLLSASVSRAQDQMRHVAVEGIGRVSAVPDMGLVHFGVQREARDARAAMLAASEAMDGILARITEAGIAPEDVQTTRIGIDPRWQHDQNGGSPRITGYVASNSLQVTVRDLDRVGPLLDAVVDEGVNVMGGLSFSIANPERLEDEARRKAVEDARRKADILAGAAGAELGGVISIAEGTQQIGPGPMFEAAMADRSAVPVAAGQMDIEVTVRAVFALGG